MKITAVETVVVNMPMKIAGPAPMLGGKARTSIDTLLVRIDTDEGVSGWGEAFGHRIWPATRAAIDTLIGRAVHRTRSDRDRRARERPAAQSARRGPQRPGDVRGVGDRHRAVGHRRQARRFAACTACSAGARGATCRPTRASCATAMPRRLHTTPRKRSPAAIAPSRCTRSKRRRSRRRAKRRVPASS